MFVPLLRNAGLLADTPHLLCGPRQAGLAPATVEDMEQLWQQADRDAFQRRARHLAGNYAYTLGYRDDAGILHGLRHNDPYQPILADHCPGASNSSNSPNHGGDGQNVLYSDNHVRWCVSPNVGGEHDNIYLNRHNRVEAGIGPDDTVLGPGEATPGCLNK